MMTSNTLPAAAILQNATATAPRIPFENSKTMDECRIQVLRKFKKEIVETVRFSDVSETLIACGLVSKEECYEICKLSVSKQMLQCYQKVHDIMDILVCQKTMSSNNNGNNATSKTRQSSMMEEKQKGLVKELWNNFVASLRKEHYQLATKMENELDKITENKLLLKRSNNGSKLRKEDIGSPTGFQHIQHFGLITRSKSEPLVQLRSSKERNQKKLERRLSAIEEKAVASKVGELHKGDPDLLEFFKRAGVSPRHLIDPVTRSIILKFIADNGGINAIRKEVNLTAEVPQKDSNETTKTDNQHKGNREYQVGEHKDSKNQQGTVSLPHAPANVPFEPTPRPAPPNLFYF